MKKTYAISIFLINVLFYFNYAVANDYRVWFDVEPNANPTYIEFSNVKAYTFTASFEKVSTANSYIVLISEEKTILGVPQDGKTYKRGDRLFNAKVVYVGNDTSFTPRAIRANTSYSFLVFAYNGSGGQENYVQQKPTMGIVNTSGLSIGTYYEGVSKTAPNFISALTELIHPHKVVSYSNYKTTLLQNLELRDTINGQVYVECVYSGERKIVSEPFDWVKSGFSREHSFPHSWMPSYPADNPPLPEYSDLYNLYPTNLEKANTIRSNYPLGEIDGKVTYEYLKGRLGYSSNQLVYEPRDRHKGNVARAIFYMCIAYNGNNNISWGLPTKQNQDILKKWHFQDSPDNEEIARQEYIFSLQGNRNPFIDSAMYVCSIDFEKLLKHTKCENDYQSDVKELINKNEIPFSVEGNLLCFNSIDKLSNFCILNLLGKKVTLDSINNECIVLHQGMYIATFEVNAIHYTYKFFVSDF